MNVAGGWLITDDAKEFKTCGLPENVASAFAKAKEGLDGAQYEPLMYLATQVVSGVNHMILCRQTLMDKDYTTGIVKLILNIPANGEPSIVTIDSLF